MTLTPQQKEELRIAILAYLSARHPLAFNRNAIRDSLLRRQLVDFLFDSDAAESAMALLIEMKLITPQTEALGTTKYYAASYTGLLEAERRGII
jgi:hypothetical protein